MGAVPITLERGRALQRQSLVWSIHARLAAVQSELDELREQVARLNRLCDDELQRVKHRKTRKRDG